MREVRAAPPELGLTLRPRQGTPPRSPGASSAFRGHAPARSHGTTARRVRRESDAGFFHVEPRRFSC